MKGKYDNKNFDLQTIINQQKKAATHSDDTGDEKKNIQAIPHRREKIAFTGSVLQNRFQAAGENKKTIIEVITFKLTFKLIF